MTKQLELELETEQVDGELLAQACWEYVEADMSDTSLRTDDTLGAVEDARWQLNMILDQVNKRGVTKIL